MSPCTCRSMLLSTYRALHVDSGLSITCYWFSFHFSSFGLLSSICLYVACTVRVCVVWAVTSSSRTSRSASSSPPTCSVVAWTSSVSTSSSTTTCRKTPTPTCTASVDLSLLIAWLSAALLLTKGDLGAPGPFHLYRPRAHQNLANFCLVLTFAFHSKCRPHLETISHSDCCNNNSNSHNNVYGAVIVAVHCHCKGSPGLFDDCSTSAGWLPTFGPSQSVWVSTCRQSW